jgi:hypothetical protein
MQPNLASYNFPLKYHRSRRRQCSGCRVGDGSPRGRRRLRLRSRQPGPEGTPVGARKRRLLKTSVHGSTTDLFRVFGSGLCRARWIYHHFKLVIVRARDDCHAFAPLVASGSGSGSDRAPARTAGTCNRAPSGAASGRISPGDKFRFAYHAPSCAIRPGALLPWQSEAIACFHFQMRTLTRIDGILRHARTLVSFEMIPRSPHHR